MIRFVWLLFLSFSKYTCESSHLPNDLSISNSGIANSGQLWLDTVLLGVGGGLGCFMISLSSLY